MLPSNQGSAAWLAERAGHATASCFVDILAVSAKGLPLKAREDYLMKLVVERLTGKPVESASSMAMNWRSDCERFARKECEAQSGNIVKEVGFAKHPLHPWVGASADGLCGKAASRSSRRTTARFNWPPGATACRSITSRRSIE